MIFTPPHFHIGIEEEYLIVDKQTRALTEPPREMFEACVKTLGEQVAPEFMRSQIEVNTPPSHTIGEARAHLVELRKTISDIAAQYGLAPIAASTHPFSEWSEQVHTDAERYNVIAEDLQAVVRRLLISGMHVHVSVGDDDLRIDLMNQVTYFLPHLLALSTSSPYWQGIDTGLSSYRLSVWDEMPRTGLPNLFDSQAEYQRHVDMMVNAGLIEDGSKIWWDIRPSSRFPTLEMRICDVCTDIDDAAAIAALYASLLHMLYRLRLGNQRWRQYATMLINENRWRAQRYGIDDGLVDFGKGQIVPFNELADELLELVAEDADILGCRVELEHIRTICKRGTSAHRQRAAYARAIDAGDDDQAALNAVVDGLIDETITSG
jgi:glutamate---cysteine ligase / carboxylate-amine ligase